MSFMCMRIYDHNLMSSLYRYPDSETSIIRTPLGPPLTVLFMEMSLFWRFYLYTCQCEGCQMGQSSGVLLREALYFGGVL